MATMPVEPSMPPLWCFGTAELNELNMELRVNGMSVALGARPLAMLLQLLRAGGRLVTRDNMIASVWGRHHIRSVSSDALDRAIHRLRIALAEENRHYIATVKGAGWRFDCARPPRDPITLRAAAHDAMRREQPAPGGGGFILGELLGSSPGTEIWVARRPGELQGEARVFKLVTDDTGRAAMRIALTQHLQLQQRLGDRPDIVRIRNWSLERLPCFLEYEHAGQDLASWAAEGGHLRPMRLTERLRIFIGIAETVAAAHNVGILHQELTPDNILVARERSGWRTRLAGFGGSGLHDCTYMKRGREPDAALPIGPLVCAPRSAYLAPELREGAPMTRRSEVYALGVMLRQIAAGDFTKTLEAGWSGDMDAGVSEVIAAATQRDPAGRTATVEDLLDHLRQRCTAATQRATRSWLWAVPDTDNPQPVAVTSTQPADGNQSRDRRLSVVGVRPVDAPDGAARGWQMEDGVSP